MGTGVGLLALGLARRRGHLVRSFAARMGRGERMKLLLSVVMVPALLPRPCRMPWKSVSAGGTSRDRFEFRGGSPWIFRRAPGRGSAPFYRADVAPNGHSRLRGGKTVFDRSRGRPLPALARMNRIGWMFRPRKPRSAPPRWKARCMAWKHSRSAFVRAATASRLPRFTSKTIRDFRGAA